MNKKKKSPSPDPRKRLVGRIKYVCNINGFLDKTKYIVYGGKEKPVFLFVNGEYLEDRYFTRSKCERMIKDGVWHEITPPNSGIDGTPQPPK